MHDFEYDHEHELDEHDFLGCCKNCRRSLEIIKPYVLNFSERIKKYSIEMLLSMTNAEIYRLYQLLDDIAHMEVGNSLGELILTDPDIRKVLPTIHSYYAVFFSVHEMHLAEELLKSDEPLSLLESFPLYPRYVSLVRKQVEAIDMSRDGVLAFIGCGAVPLTQILLSRLYGIRSLGLDVDSKAVELAQKCIKHIGLESDIQIVQGDESALWELDWDMVLVAALAEPKPRIFRTLHEILKMRGPAPVIYRTYTGMRAVLYSPVQPEDIKGFNIVRQINPTGRVNNTLVFLEIET